MVSRVRAVRSGGLAARPARPRRANYCACAAGESTDTQAPPENSKITVPGASIDCVGEGQAVTCSVPDSDSLSTSEPQVETFLDNGPLSALIAGTLLISPFFFWGTSMVAMKIAAPHSTPLFTASIRLIPAGAAVVAWAAWKSKPMPNSAMAWLVVLLFGIVDGTFFQGLLAEGLQRVPAGIGSVIIDSQPLTVAVAAALLFGESLSSVAVAGLMLGLSGLILLELPPEMLVAWMQLDFSAQTAMSLGPWWDNGQLLMLLAAQSMAAGTLMVPWVTRYVDPIMATGWHMILGGVPLVAFSLLTEGPELAANLPQINGGDVVALTYTSLLGSAAAYGVFFYNASKGNLTKLSSLTFLTPVFATFAGFVALQETLTPLQLAGATVTLGGVLLMNYKPADSSSKSI